MLDCDRIVLRNAERGTGKKDATQICRLHVDINSLILYIIPLLAAAESAKGIRLRKGCELTVLATQQISISDVCLSVLYVTNREVILLVRGEEVEEEIVKGIYSTNRRIGNPYEFLISSSYLWLNIELVQFVNEKSSFT